MLFIKGNDSVVTGDGKVEILLTPGVFFLLGSNSEIHITAVSLTGIQIDMIRGESMVEVDELRKERPQVHRRPSRLYNCQARAIPLPGWREAECRDSVREGAGVK